MNESLHLTAMPLTAAAFAPYGEVFGAPDAIGSKSADWPVPGFDHAKFCLSISRRAPAKLPFTTQIMERHLQSQQIFFPLRISRFLVLVAPGGGAAPDLDRLVAFIGQAGQALNYRIGTWHHPFTVFDAEAEYASLMFKDGSPRDEEFVDLPRPLHITA
jgi:ureidoglycolate lyase